MPDNDVTFDNPINATSEEEAKAALEGDTSSPIVRFSKHDYVKFNGKDAEITFVHDDGTYDVQFIDEGGEALRDENNQPYWFTRIPKSELSDR